MSIPLDANFKSLSCQLGGLRLNGIVEYPPEEGAISGTAQSTTVLTIDDSAVVQHPVLSNSTPVGYFKVKVSNEIYFIPLFQ
uniref:Uncharacterized protein n=1 Tax=viral metagenome TaxID=1070528 RepID=A0A6C0IAL2_9ZZZZ